MQKLTELQEDTGLDITVSVGAVIWPQHAANDFSNAPYRGQLQPEKHDYKELWDWVVEYNANRKKGLPVSAFRVGLEDTSVLYGEQKIQ